MFEPEYITYTGLEDLEMLRRLIKATKSFRVEVKVEEFTKVVTILEDIIEQNKMTCRIRTASRAIAGIFPVIAIGMGVHNLGTFNPDYVIVKHPLSRILDVNYYGDKGLVNIVKNKIKN
jgi:hypothetical protein